MDGGGEGGGGSEAERQKFAEGEVKVKRKMKTAAQLEILEKTYAVETYPSEALRAELSVQLGLSDRQLQMWFCHRRLKDRKAPQQPAKRPRKEVNAVGSSGGGIGDEAMGQAAAAGEGGNEQHFPGSGSGSPFGHLERVLQPRAVPRTVAAAAAAASDMPAMKRYYEPPQAISELRAIAFVEAQLGETLREDGPILGMEFDPLPPGAFGAPIMTTTQQKSAVRPYEAKLFERPDAKLMKGTSRALHEYQFLPEQPSVRSDTYERAVPSQYYGLATDVPSNRIPLSTGRSYKHSNEQVSSVYGFQGQNPSLSVLPPQGRQGHLLPSVSGDYDIVSRKSTIASIGVDAHFGAHPITELDNPFVSSERRASHEDDILRMERKRKSEEARIAREVEAHEKRIRKELEKQNILRQKREEQMKKEMERQDRERRKEEERVLREKQREEERYQREQRREMERREKFLQKESIRAEKLRLKEEMRREKEAARLKAANERATARRIAKESMELIDDERLELMEIAASSKGFPSMSLDSETLQNLDSLREMLPEFPPKSVRLKKPFKIQPWAESEENIGNLLMVWRFLITFADVLGLWPFTLDEFVQAFHDFEPRLLGEIHVALLKSIIKDIEDVARTPTTGLGPNQNTAAYPGGGHPQIVEGAYAWGFDIRNWKRHLNPLTWPEVLRQFALAAGYGPKLRKRNGEQAFLRDENEGNDGEGIISDLRNGAAAENALAIMQERGFSNRRRSRHRLTPGTVKYAAFHVLSLEGSRGLSILEVAEKIQRSGLRDLTTSKTPEASIAAALSRDTKLFERTAPSTYCVRPPYRKDPADGEAILTAARQKIQIFKNGSFDGEEADDAERDDAEKDEDSESDVGDDAGVDDICIEQKLNEDVLPSSDPNRLVEKSSSGSGKLTSYDKIVEIPQVGLGSSANHLLLVESGSLKEVKMNRASIDHSDDVVRIHNDATEPAQEDTVIDESNSGEPWVLGLTEGEYSDLSVEERLHALVALIGVANEGNSIRIVLEERLEAANALKKQMWAEAQIDKRRMREEFAMKLQYPSFVGNRAGQNHSIASLEGRQSPAPAVDQKHAFSSVNPVVQQEVLGDPQNDLNLPNDTHTEMNLLQDGSVGVDNLQLQQPGCAGEKSRSQLKAFIGHKAEEMYAYRSLPLGQDRRRNRYWQFVASASRNDPGCGRIFIELRDGRWRVIDSEDSYNRLLASLDVRGLRESHLHSMLQMIEASVKETFKNNSGFASKSELLVEDTISTGNLDSASRPDCSSNIYSSSGSQCISNSDNSECLSSFIIGLGRDESERNDALKRYQDFEKWLWEECFNSSILCAMKYGETRCRPLLGICGDCHDLYFFEENYCRSCCQSSKLNFTEQVAQFKEKLKGEAYFLSHNGDSSPLRIKMLKIQLALIEASILEEALQPAWSDDHRRSWGMKLLIASSVEALLQVLTLLEGAIKRDFLSSNYETTDELLGSSNITGCVNNDSTSHETVSVLPWLPRTTSSVALRLMELDNSIYYLLSQKEESEKDKETADLMASPSKFSGMKNTVEGEAFDVAYEAGNLQQEPWGDPGSGHISSGRGRGRTPGRGRSCGGRSQKRAIGLRSNTSNNDRVGQLVGWKGRPRGRGGRKQGRRTARSKKKAVKKVTTENVSTREFHEDVVFEKSGSASLQDWNVEETTGLQFTNVEDGSSSERPEYENDNGQESGDEYDEDLAVDDYSNMYSRQPEHFMGGADYGEEDYRAEEDDINGDDDEDDDDQGDVDVDGFFNGDSDENRDLGRGEIGNPDDITESSSSGYSD